MSDTPLVDSSGKPVKTVRIPTVKYTDPIDKKDYLYAVNHLKAEEIVNLQDVQGIRPADIIRELRAMYRDLSQKFILLSAALTAAAGENPRLFDFLEQVGLEVVDLNGNYIQKFSNTPEDCLPQV